MILLRVLSLVILFSITQCDWNVDTILNEVYSGPLNIKRQYLGPLLHYREAHANSKPMVFFKCSPLFHVVAKNDSASVWPPLRIPPSELHEEYTFGGAITLKGWYQANRQNGGDGYDWPADLIERLGEQPITCGGYNKTQCHTAILKYRDQYIAGKRGMVFGSQSPWAEAALLATGGAAHITTVEYMRIKIGHPRMAAYHPQELAEAYVDGKVPPIDFAFSFSSFEHDGLGRYGDPMRPSADLESIARVHCLLKPGGIFFLAVPVGPDCLAWNAHRIYGRLRLAALLPNWEVLDLIGAEWGLTDLKYLNWFESQPIWVLRKKHLGGGGHAARG